MFQILTNYEFFGSDQDTLHKWIMPYFFQLLFMEKFKITEEELVEKMISENTHFMIPRFKIDSIIGNFFFGKSFQI
jgi:hypothetical protein